MSTIWNVLGRACCSDAFRKELLSKTKPANLAMKDHRDLFDFVQGQTDYAPTRWDLMEINRIMSLAGRDDGPMPKIARVWNPAPRTDLMLHVFGLGLMDEGTRTTILSGTVEEACRALADGPPSVRLAFGETRALRELLERKSGGTPVVDLMREVESLGWIPGGDPRCDPGATFSTSYFHANPVIIGALQDIDELRDYLAGEPANRLDPVSMQRRVQEILNKHLGP